LLVAVRSPDGIVHAFRDETSEQALENAGHAATCRTGCASRSPESPCSGDAALDETRRLVGLLVTEAEPLAGYAWR
jgi:hypothetical protein